jgi:hypothetical protein
VDDGIRTLDFGAGRQARAATVWQPDALAAALARLGIPGPRPVVVVVGGAGGLSEARSALIEPLLAQALLPIIAGLGAVVVDGGTDAGVMRLMGRLRARGPHPFPLLGVAAEGTVTLPGQVAGTSTLDANHSHFLLVPGDEWGDESPWLARAATVLAGSAPSATLLINGGTISFADASHSLAEQRPVLVLAGTGRAADRIAAAVDGDHGDAPARELASAPRVHFAPVADATAVRAALSSLL